MSSIVTWKWRAGLLAAALALLLERQYRIRAADRD